MFSIGATAAVAGPTAAEECDGGAPPGTKTNN